MAKRKQGRIYRRGEKWYVDIPTAGGGRCRKSTGTSRKNAQRVLGLMREKLREEGMVQEVVKVEKGKDPRVSTCWNHYIRRLGAEGKKSTVLNAECNRKHWAAIEKKRVSRLEQSDIDNIIDRMSTAISTKNGAIKIFRAALRRARRDGLLKTIPVEIRERKDVTPLPETVSRQEFRDLASACKDYRARTLVTLAMFAGLRHQECRYLTLQDLDWNAGMIRITAKPAFDWSPKTYEERAVPMARVLEETLKNHIALLPRRVPWLVEHKVPEWLFPGSRGYKPLTQNSTSRLVAAAYKKAGIGGHRPGLHRLRKSWATNVLKTNGLGVLMRLGGWNSLETVKRYIGTDTDAARSAIDSLEY